jgi:hypothetical protein
MDRVSAARTASLRVGRGPSPGVHPAPAGSVASVAVEAAALIERFVADHGRRPGVVEQMRLRQVATVASRTAKTLHSLGSLTASWRRRTAVYVEEDGQVAWAAGLARRNGLPLVGAGEEVLEGAARAVVAAVADRRATYGRQNLLAEAHRLLHGVRFASPADRVVDAGSLKSDWR